MTAKSTALRLLTLRSHSRLELQKKLSLKGFSSAEIQEALEACTRLGYLNDEEEAKRRLLRWKNRGYGPRFVALKLKEAGLKVSQGEAEEQKETIRALLRKGAWAKKEKRKLIGALQRRGFDLECILAVIPHDDLST